MSGYIRKLTASVLLITFLVTICFSGYIFAQEINSMKPNEESQQVRVRNPVTPDKPKINYGPYNGIDKTKKHAYEPFKKIEKKETKDTENTAFKKDRILVKIDTSKHSQESLQAQSTPFTSSGIIKFEKVFKVDSGNGNIVKSAGQSSKSSAEWYRAYVKDGSDILNTVETISIMPGVVSVEPDYLRNLSELSIPDPSTDGQIGEQWYLDKVGVKQAWSYLQSQGINPGGRRDVVVAVIDTGVDYRHPDLTGNIWTNTGEIPGNGVDDDKNGFVDDINGACTVGDRYSGESGNPMDDHGHGTHVAGIIAAQGNNNVGGVGVAYNVQIMPIKAAQSSGVLSSSDIAQAIYYAVDKGADVINMSFGGYGRSTVEEDALQVAFSTSVLVAAAGNDGKPNLPHPLGIDLYPAAYPWVLGVMAEEQNPAANGDNLASFSNWDYMFQDSHEYEVMAPGAGIFSTLPGEKYAKWSGTSMAAPVVSGIAALLRSKFADKDTYSSRFIMGQIVSTGDMKQGKTFIDPSGSGTKTNSYHEVNALKALTDTPEPELSYLEHYIFDKSSISQVNNGDGTIDAGETIDIAMVIRNHWGKADNVRIKLDTKSGAGMDDPYVTFITDTVEYGAVGTYATDDNGLIYDNQGVVTGVNNPFRIKVADNTPNDHVIPVNITMTAVNGFDPGDSTNYTFRIGISLAVRNGQKLPAVITSDMVLTKDKYWIVPNATVIETGAKVTVGPGTQIQFWSSEPEDPYAEQAMAYIQVKGQLIVNGTAEEPVEMFASSLYPGYEVKIFSTDYLNQYGDSGGYRGNAEIRYAKVMNPNISVNLVDHCYFSQDSFSTMIKRYLYEGKVRTEYFYGPVVYGQTISNSRFYQLGNSGDYYLYKLRVRGENKGNLFDSCNYYMDEQAAEDNVYLKNYKLDGQQYGYRNYLVSNGKDFGYRINNESALQCTTPLKFNDNGSTYFRVYPNLGSDYIGYSEMKMVEEFAKKIGGHIVTINDAAENEFLRANFSGCRIGLSNFEQADSFKWVSGEPVTYTNPNWDATLPNIYKTFVVINSDGKWQKTTYGSNPFIIEVSGVSYVTGVILDKKVLTLGAGGASTVLTPTILPVNANNKNVTWLSSKPEVASVDVNGVVMPLTVGTCTITVTTEDGGFTDTCEVTVRQIVPASGVTLDKSELIMAVGTEQVLNASVLPADCTNKNVTWSTSNMDIAEVDLNGRVTAKSVGDAVVKVTTDDGGFTALCTIRVVQPVTGITLSQGFLRMVIGDSPVTLTANVQPGSSTIKDVTWSSSNLLVVTVDANGVVTPKGTGTALITATTKDRGYTASCTVTVWDRAVSFITSKIASGYYHTVALNNDGTVWSWGWNENGQLGDGSQINRYSPVAVSGISDAKSIAAGYNHTVALKNDGTVWSWGYNERWKLGYGSTYYSYKTPNQVQNMKDVSAVAAGYNHTVALKSDRTVWAWGDNGYGQLGDGTNTYNEYMIVQSMADATAIGAGYYHTVALKSDGTVWTWGCNGNGQLGDGTNTDRYIPSKVPSLTGVKAIAVGSWHSLALKNDGTVWGWGNGYGYNPVMVQNLSGITAIAAGDNLSATLKSDGTVWTWNYNYGVSKVQNIDNVTSIACGGNNVVVTKNDGTIWAWGNNQYGQLGNLTTMSSSTPVQTLFGILPDTESPQIISTNPQNGATGVPVDTAITITFKESVRQGDRFGLITLKDSDNNIISLKSKTIDNDKLILQLLNPLSQTKTYTVTIPYHSLKDLSNNNFASDYSFSFTPQVVGVTGITLDKENLTLWGRADKGMLVPTFTPYNATNRNVNWSSSMPEVASVDGNGVVTPLSVGTAVITVTSEDGGFTDSCTVEVKEIVNVSGVTLNKTSLSIGINENAYLSAVVLPETATNRNVTWSSNNHDIVVVDQSGRVTGKDEGTAVITATTVDGGFTADCTVKVVVPVSKISLNKGFLRLVKGDSPTILTAIVEPSNATIKDVTWSSSNNSIITVDGNGAVTPVNTGTALIIASTPDGAYSASCIVTVWDTAVEFTTSKISGGYYHSLALNSDGTVWSWGLNEYGRLGDGTIINRSTPVQVKNLTGVVDVAASEYHSVALKDDGTVWTWGYNNYYQLGNSSRYNSYYSPIKLQNLTDVTAIAAGQKHTVALKNDGTVWTWGYNGQGQLGDSTMVDRYIPVQVQDLTDVVAIAAGSNHTVALKRDGTVWAWGNNDSYQLGDGTTNRRLTPVMMQGLASVKAISAGMDHTLALKNDGTVWACGVDWPNTLTVSSQLQNISGVKSIAAGNRFSMVLKNDGTLWTWGYNQFGRLGNGSSEHADSPTQVQNLTDVTSISPGYYHSVAAKGDGTVWSWGNNEYGQLGNLSTENSSVPVQTLFGILPDTTPPQLVSTSPLNGALNVPVNTVITITFSEAMKQGDNFGLIALKDSNNKTVSIKKKSFTGNILTLEPLSALSPGTTYTVYIPGNSFRDLFNNSLAADCSFSFRTEGNTAQSILWMVTQAFNAFTRDSILSRLEGDRGSTEENPVTPNAVTPDGKITLTQEEINNARAEFINEGGLSTIKNNAILNRWWDPDVSHWMRFTSNDGDQYKRYMAKNYWGTTSDLLIGKALVDFNDFRSMEEIIYKPILTEAPETAYPFVTDVYVSTSAEERASKVGAEKITVHVLFNRDMNINIQPQVTFGPDMPTTDYTVHGVNGGWAGSRHWAGEFNVTPITGDGYQFFRVAGAAAANDPWLVTGNDSERFRFEIITSGTESMNLQASGAEGKIILSWAQDDFDLLAGYNIYRSDTLGGTYTKINSTVIPKEQKTYEDTNVVPGKVYYYKFKVVKTDLTESDFSNVASAAALDTVPPVITHTPVKGAAHGLPLQVYADVTDNVSVAKVSLYYRKSGTTAYTEVEMVKTTGSRYSATVEGSLVQAPGLEYYIEATDGISIVRNGSADRPNQVVITDAPKITSVAPTEGPEDGGTQVIITGANFKQDASVTFGGAPASNVIVESSNRITAATPAHLPETVDVSVANTDGYKDTLLRGFTYKKEGVEVNIPSVQANKGTVFEVPINVVGASGLSAADIKVSFDKDVLSVRNVRSGSIAANFTLQSNKSVLGEVSISMASATSASGSGPLAYIEFEVLNTTKASSPLTLQNIQLNSGAIVVTPVNGTFTVSTTHSISGSISSYTGSLPVSGVNLKLEGQNAYTAVSGSNGSYILSEIVDGAYKLTASKDNEVSGISAYDASLILQSAAGLLTLSANQKIAADVDNNGKVDSMDASYVLKKVAGLIEVPFPGAGKVWTFIPSERSYNSLSNNLTGQNFTAILLGDVSGNWTNTGSGIQGGNTAEFTLDTKRAEPGSTITLPVRINTNQGKMYGSEIVVSYDKNTLTALSVDKAVLSNNFTIAANLNTPGIIRIAIAGAQPLAGNGMLLNINFKTLDNTCSVPVGFDKAEVNESGTSTVKNSGKIIVAINGDVNLDNKVDDSDLELAKGSYGIINKDIDMNGDGRIDLYDMVTIGKNIGGQRVASELPSANSLISPSVKIDVPSNLSSIERFDVKVNVNDVNDFFGGSFDMLFNPNTVKVMGITHGDIFRAKENLAKDVIYKSDNDNGVFEYCRILTTNTSGISGSGTFVTIHFKVVGDGQFKVESTRSNMQDLVLSGINTRFMISDSSSMPVSYMVNTVSRDIVKDSKGPSVMEVYPQEGMVDVPTDCTIKIVFDEDIDSVVTSGRSRGSKDVSLQDSKGNIIPIDCRVSDNALIIKPRNALKNGTNYTILVPLRSLMDKQGNMFDKDYSFGFKTISNQQSSKKDIERVRR